jgi:hypothetical protein
MAIYNTFSATKGMIENADKKTLFEVSSIDHLC